MIERPSSDLGSATRCLGTLEQATNTPETPVLSGQNTVTNSTVCAGQMT